MSDDQTEITRTVVAWVEAIRARDIDGVVAAHADDIVMFDVPPPHDGIRGIVEYRQSWPPFFEFLATGATFELANLDVVTGDRVAYAYALLRCGRPEFLATNPGNRLRLTLGLRKVDGRWLIAHEHHSFATTD
ncbi:YybH family protein [Mycobacterium sp. smrl_JER01]|uniref:YybH family protein n=1 Tax=Mycobacterium sp. smrl_JER01 TaxID=3402633 RepID=UPI003ACBC142